MRGKGVRARASERERKRERGVGDPRVCESMPGFNDQQRGRGCILTAAEKRKERSVEEGEEEKKGEEAKVEVEEKKEERDRQITPGAKRQEAREPRLE